MGFYVIPPTITVKVVVDVPVLDRWLEWLKATDQTQAKIDALAARLNKSSDEVEKALDEKGL